MTISNSLILADNAFGTIGSGLSVSDTALTFTTGHGARFPAVAAGQVLYCVILNSTNVLEEVVVTAHTNGADSATIVRGTTPKTWSAGDRIEARVSSTVLKRLQDESLKSITITTADAGATYTGAMDVPGLGYVTGLIYPMTLATSNSGTAPTIALDGLAAVTVVLDGGGALVASQMPVNGLYKYDGTNFILLNPVPRYIASPVLSGTATGTYTLGGTPTIASPVLSGTASGTYTLGGTPSATTPSAGDNTTRIASTAYVQGEFSTTRSLGNPGYQKIPSGGLLLQWNSTTVTTDGGGNATVSFPAVFSSLFAVILGSGSSGTTVQVTATSTSNFTIHASASNTSVAFHYIALGT